MAISPEGDSFSSAVANAWCYHKDRKTSFPGQGLHYSEVVLKALKPTPTPPLLPGCEGNCFPTGRILLIRGCFTPSQSKLQDIILSLCTHAQMVSPGHTMVPRHRSIGVIELLQPGEALPINTVPESEFKSNSPGSPFLSSVGLTQGHRRPSDIL